MGVTGRTTQLHQVVVLVEVEVALLVLVAQQIPQQPHRLKEVMVAMVEVLVLVVEVVRLRLEQMVVEVHQ